MDTAVETELHALLHVIFGLQVPGEKEIHLQVKRPEGMGISDFSWVEELIEAIVKEVLLSFDLRRKTEHDDPQEIEQWKKPVMAGGWAERRKNYRLRIRTSVDDLFEKSLPLADVSATVRAWKIQIVDKCADAILDRFHARPASSGPWQFYRRTLYDIGQDLQQALGCSNLFLMSGRVTELKAVEDAIERAHRAIRELARDLEETDTEK